MEVLEDLLVTIQEVVQQVLLQIIQGQLHKDILQDKDIVTKQITPTVAVEVELVLLVVVDLKHLFLIQINLIIMGMGVMV